MPKRLKKDSLFYCPDYNDCQIWGICDQLCEDRPGTHRCSCADGYFLEHGRVCKANVSGTGSHASHGSFIPYICYYIICGLYQRTTRHS